MLRNLTYILAGLLLFALVYAGNRPPLQDTGTSTGKLFVEKGKITFISKAPLETIQANSDDLKGVIATDAKTFAFSVPYTSFLGFNSPLQREHFNENFMESDKYEKATYTGRIIDPVKWSDTGTYMIRVKGIMDIHGVKQERILTGQITVKENYVLIYSKFPIQISDHNIAIPKVLHQKIAEEVQVTVAARLVYKSAP